ncbi:zinc finger MYM-type protein 1-like [Aphis craccivora]|uniref:Zinc finger MYM-type protein 1-like n=1 Tax=Aphis craccivora TaxID=307492 RepID=A0A6G0YYF7_APHCR|nr:zinc finger MYM-type protein 1-like [Aphis craccivora]
MVWRHLWGGKVGICPPLSSAGRWRPTNRSVDPAGPGRVYGASFGPQATYSVFLSSSPNYFNHNCSFLNTFLKHYQHFNINSLLLESEFQSAKAFIQNSNTNQSNNDIFSISKILNKISNAFPETLKIITILLTLPVSSASNKRFFSSLKLVKTHLRLTMDDERVSDLLVIAMEKETASLINLNQAVDMFGAMKTRRYPVTA